MMLFNTQFRIAFVCITWISMPLWGHSQHVEQALGADHALDPRIMQHYTAAEIAEIRQQTPHKLAQLNYYFRASWHLKADPGCTTCPLPDPATIDVTVYEHLRMLDRPNTVPLGPTGPYLVLHARQDVLAHYQALK